MAPTDNDRAHRRDMVLLRMNVTAEERVALLHLRGHRHHGPSCPVCRAEQAGIAIGRRLAEGDALARRMKEVTSGE